MLSARRTSRGPARVAVAAAILIEGVLESLRVGLKEIAKALNRSEESTKDFAKKNKIDIAKKR